MKTRGCTLLLTLALLIWAPPVALAGEGYATVTRKWVINTGGWRDRYAFFDYHVVYRWPRYSYWAGFDPRSCRAQAALREIRASGGVGRTWADARYYYVEVTAGIRARVVNPLSYGCAPYAYQNQINDFASEFRIKYRYR